MKIYRFFTILMMIALILSVQPQSAWAQNPQPPVYEDSVKRPNDGIWFDRSSNQWMSSDQTINLNQVDLASTGGPDGYGYTWDDTVPLSWINATGGTVVGFSGSSSGQRSGFIPLPFEFKYYENTYTNLIIAASGYLGFTDEGMWPWQPRLPSPSLPNNIVAPYATPLNLASSGSTSRVYYTSGGTAPNRYFVVEWYQVKWNDETYTFEVILYENGDIVFQYQQMTYIGGGYSCGAAGIEDSLGMDGLKFIDFCVKAQSNKAVRFYRPAAGPHIQMLPLNQGSFTGVGQSTIFPLSVRNTGEAGSDTYDIQFVSTWPVAVVDASSGQPLSDTDFDGMIDTGSLPQGAQKNIQVSVQAPSFGNVGDYNVVNLTVLSSLNPSKNRTTTLRSSIPAPFGQAFLDQSDGAMRIELVQPDSRKIVKAAPDMTYGMDQAMIEKSDGFAYFWSRYGSSNNVWWENIEFALLDKAGNLTRGVTRLTDNSSATLQTYDWSSVLASTPDGRIGVAWIRYVWNSSNNRYQYNVFFALLDTNGNVVYGPANITNNTVWSSDSAQNHIYFRSLKIAATGDNRFAIAWERQSYVSSNWVTDIYYSVRDSSGGVVKSVTKYTNDTPGWDLYYETPVLAGLSNNRVLLAWLQSEGVAYIVLDSAGIVVYGPAVINNYLNDLDAVQFSGGRILLAGERWSSFTSQIVYYILENGSYGVVEGPEYLDNPSAITGDGYVSVSADQTNHAVLTWMDSDNNSQRNLFYALVDSGGSVVTQPMIFLSGTGNNLVETSYMGYGNSSYNLVSPTTPSVDLQLSGLARGGGSPGGISDLVLNIQNKGASPASSVVLTATLDPSLTYSSASPAPTSVVGNVITWNLVDIAFMGSGKVYLSVNLPSAAGIGTLYPISWEITSAGPEALPADNSFSTQVMESLQVFLPAVRR